MIVVGAGIVGLACAWLLQRRGHRALLLAPALGAAGAASGSGAALGMLMAHAFQRSSGRGWRLRQRSLGLWSQWRRELEGLGHPIPWRAGVLLAAANADALAKQARLVRERQQHGPPLELWGREQLEALTPALPPGAPGGLHSPADGQLDPGAAMAAFAADARCHGLSAREDTAVALEPQGDCWRVALQGGGTLEAEWVVLTAGLACRDLLAGLGQEWPLEPVLGQALELELTPLELTSMGDPTGGDPPPWNWPGAVVWQGINLVPRPDLPGGHRFWLGATLEPGVAADPAALAALRDLSGAAPPWLRQARLVRQWQGLRPRPVGRPAPLLEVIAPGLLLAAGHYRNGVLLAPASAEWVAGAIEAPR